MKIYTTSREDYLKALLVLQKQIGDVHSVDVARYLGFSKPSVSNAVSLLTKEGYIYMDKDHTLQFTDAGREIAEKTYERHCFFAEKLIELGVDEKIANEDACKMEHAISDLSFSKLKEKYGNKDNK